MGKSKWAPVLTGIISLAVVCFLFKFNKGYHSYDAYMVTNVAALMWLPLVFLFFAMRHEPAAYGFTLRDFRTGMTLSGISFVLLLPLLVIASRWSQFQSYYPIYKQAEFSLAAFGYFELTYGMYLFCWEFFFRGFMLFGLQRLMGWWTIIPQALAFGIMHAGKPGPEFLASFGAGLILGIIALRAKSFVPCFALHWAAALTFDILIILAKRGVLF
jgi:membrane protease YdiL (CAAX protease family)